MKCCLKNKLCLLLIIFLINYSSELSKKKFHKKSKKEKLIPVELTKPSEILVNAAGYKSPKMVDYLSNGQYPDYYDATIIEPTTFQGNNVYYDGRANLNSLIVTCEQMTMFPTRCLQDRFCGWCGSSNSCIPGTPKGPSVKCEGKFDFSSPDATFNPLTAGTINLFATDNEGKPLLHKTRTPELEKIALSPYM